MKKIGLILLSGGLGTRFGGDYPKQYLQLNNKPIAVFALERLLKEDHYAQVVVVCEEQYQDLFLQYIESPLSFASPGKRRQDSVANGFSELTADIDVVCIHDGARPFPTAKMVNDVVNAAVSYGAAAVGVPIKYTLKECDEEGIVVNTPDRTLYYEIQTPQAVQKDLLKNGLESAHSHQLTVTDDTSLAELVGGKVKIVPGHHENIKITTVDDWIVAQVIANGSVDASLSN